MTLVAVTAAVGARFAAPAASRIVRTRVMGLAGALIAAGSLSASFPDEAAVLGISRVGLGIGAASAVVPSYIGEISPTRMGGAWDGRGNRGSSPAIAD